MLDLLVHNATLPDGRTGMSVTVRDGRIVEVAAGLGPAQASAHETLDAQGLLLAPPFVDAHFHMDATLSYGLPRVNRSGTLLEGIALWGELKPLLTPEALVERALAYCDWAVAQGPAGDPHPRRRLRRAPARGRGAARRERSASRRTSTCSSSPFRRTACCARRARVENLQARARPRRRRRRRHPAFRAHDGRGRASVQAAVRARRRARPAGRHALRRDATTRCRATSRRWPTRRSAWACRAA